MKYRLGTSGSIRVTKCDNDHGYFPPKKREMTNMKKKKTKNEFQKKKQTKGKLTDKPRQAKMCSYLLSKINLSCCILQQDMWIQSPSLKITLDGVGQATFLTILGK